MIVPLAALLLETLAPSATSGPETKVVRVWLDASVLTRGAPVRVYVQAGEDGNLVVLHRRTDGRIEVLFPNNPAADASVRAGTYEIRGPNDRPGWVVREPDGSGMVLAALSPDPLRGDEFAREACGATPTCGAPPQSVLALAVGPLPPPELAAFSPGRGVAAPRGASGPTPLAPRPRAPEIPVRSRAPSPIRAAALVSSVPRVRSPEAASGTRGATSVEPRARVALGASGGPLSHVRYTRLSAPTPESPVVMVAARNGTGRALAPAEGVPPGRPGTFAAPGVSRRVPARS